MFAKLTKTNSKILLKIESFQLIGCFINRL